MEDFPSKFGLQEIVAQGRALVAAFGRRTETEFVRLMGEQPVGRMLTKGKKTMQLEHLQSAVPVPNSLAIYMDSEQEILCCPAHLVATPAGVVVMECQPWFPLLQGNFTVQQPLLVLGQTRDFSEGEWSRYHDISQGASASKGWVHCNIIGRIPFCRLFADGEVEVYPKPMPGYVSRGKVVACYHQTGEIWDEGPVGEMLADNERPNCVQLEQHLYGASRLWWFRSEDPTFQFVEGLRDRTWHTEMPVK